MPVTAANVPVLLAYVRSLLTLVGQQTKLILILNNGSEGLAETEVEGEGFLPWLVLMMWRSYSGCSYYDFCHFVTFKQVFQNVTLFHSTGWIRTLTEINMTHT